MNIYRLEFIVYMVFGQYYPLFISPFSEKELFVVIGIKIGIQNILLRQLQNVKFLGKKVKSQKA